MHNFISKRLLLDVFQSNGRRLGVEAVKYVPDPRITSGNTVTLLFTHALSFTKEMWEPVVSHMFAVQSQLPSQNAGVRIREVWTLDCPSHGRSASLNTNVGKITFRDYADAVATFVASHHLPPRSESPLVAVGHSFGCAALVFAYTASSKHIYDKFIMVEPAMMSPELEDKYPSFYPALIKGVRIRRRNWKSFDEASDYISTRKPWRDWDAGVRTEFVKNGLRPLVKGKPDVELACTALQEEAAYDLSDEAESLEQISQLCQTMPVHVIFGAVADLVPHREVQDNIIDGNQGRRVVSVTHISEAGHFAPFQRPHACAEAIYAAVRNTQGAKL